MIEAVAVHKSFPSRAGGVVALRGVDLRVERGELVALMGPSGSGKSTLLHLLGGLDVPTSGAVRLDGRVLSELGEAARTRVRRADVGFVFQAFNLVPVLTVAENVALPFVIAGEPPSGYRDRVAAVLAEVGLAERAGAVPPELSGGEQQRVAVARAVVTGPAVVLADEPTGSLDRETGGDVLRLLRRLGTDGHAVVVATHDLEVAAVADRIVQLRDGEIVDDTNLRASSVPLASLVRLGVDKDDLIGPSR